MNAWFRLLAAAALFAALLFLWRTLGDRSGLPPRLMTDMTARPDAAPLPPPAGTLPYAAAAPADPRSSAPNAALLFHRHCATCHGADGRGRSFVARQPGMPAVSNLRTNTASDAQKRSSLSTGRGAMPAFGSRLRPEELEALLRHVIQLAAQPASPQATDSSSPDAPPASPPAPTTENSHP